jgi:CubicO group peptidase (beta-lactamase class C family)
VIRLRAARPSRPSLALSVLALWMLAPAAGAQRAPLQGLDAYVARAVRDWRVPGLAIVVVKDGDVAFMQSYGVRELGKPEPVTVHTKFGNMSTTKAFTAMLVAMMVDSGVVRWDDPVTAHVPGFQLADPYSTRELTVRDLLTHRVGFPDPYYLWAVDTAARFDDIVRRLRLVRPASSLRSRFAYNNVTYALAGEVAARAAGTTWQALMRRRIYGPLGMTESYADGRALRAAGVADVTAPHGIVNDTVRVLPASPSDVDPVAAAGSMFSTAADMARWLRFLLDSARVGGRRLVSARNFAELFTAQQIVPPEEFYPTARLTRPHFQTYGMGWFLEDYRGEFVAFHTGSIEGRSAIVGLIPERRLGVAVMTNLDHSELRHALMYTVFDRYLGPGPGAGRDWSAEMRAMYRALADSAAARRRAREARRVGGTSPTLPLAAYAGTYADSLFGTTAVRLDGQRLTLRMGGQAADLEHWQYDVFRARWRDPFQGTDYVSFSLDPDGTVGELRMVDGPMRFRRVRETRDASGGAR